MAEVLRKQGKSLMCVSSMWEGNWMNDEKRQVWLTHLLTHSQQQKQPSQQNPSHQPTQTQHKNKINLQVPVKNDQHHNHQYHKGAQSQPIFKPKKCMIIHRTKISSTRSHIQQSLIQQNTGPLQENFREIKFCE